MSDTYTFASSTPRLRLPNLFTAQAQKEITVNEAFALLDALLHAAVEGDSNMPPADPSDGECWLVGQDATGTWAGQAGQVACRQSGNWLFVSPIDGMTIYDKSAAQIIRFKGEWISAAAVAVPGGGTVIDTEARNTLGELIASLQSIGILPES